MFNDKMYKLYKEENTFTISLKQNNFRKSKYRLYKYHKVKLKWQITILK